MPGPMLMQVKPVWGRFCYEPTLFDPPTEPAAISGNDAGILIGLGLLCRQSRRPRGSRQHRMFVDIFLLGIVQPHQSLDGFDDPLCIANEIAVGILL